MFTHISCVQGENKPVHVVVNTVYNGAGDLCMQLLDSNKFSRAARTGDHSFHGNTTMGLQLIQQIHNLFSSSSSDMAVYGAVSRFLLP